MAKHFYKKAPGASIGAKRKRVLACENCDYSSAYEAGQLLKTGGACPKCQFEQLRVFDSKREFEAFRLLKMNPDVTNIACQVRMPLSVVNKQTRKTEPLYTYILDFVYTTKDGKIHYVDVKGSSGTGDKKRYVATDVAIMKIKHFEAEYGVELEIM